MSTPCGILCSSLFLCAALAACSSSTDGSNGGSPSGGASQTSGGSGSSLGGSAVSAGGGNASSAGSPGAAGAANATAGSSAGGEPSGGAGGGVGSGGALGVAGSASLAGASNGGAGGSAHASGGAASGGASAGGAVASGGSGGTVDQSSLPSISVHLAGDSTMSNYAATTTQEGWGQEFGQYFIAKVTIDNQALPGANVQTFHASSRWTTLIGNVKAGDYVMAAFGTNDSGTTHGPVTPTDFKAEFSLMASEIAAKKATFILTTPSALQIWSGAKINNTRLQPYCDALTSLGMSSGLLVDDLNARGVEYYNSIGATAALALSFNGDKAHFDKAGATEMALLASQEIKRINSPLAAYLK